MDATWTSRWNLQFDDPAEEAAFLRYHELTSVPPVREGMLGALLSWVFVHLAFALFAREHLLAITCFLAVVYPLITATVLLARHTPTPERSRLLQHLTLATHALVFVGVSLLAQVLVRSDAMAIATVVALIYNVGSVYRHRTGQVLLAMLFGCGFYLMVLLYLGLKGELSDQIRWLGPVLVTVISLQAVTVARGAERSLRETFLKDQLISSQQRQIQAEKARAEALLLNVLPESIATILKARPGVIADDQAEASVLFADLAGFTSLSSGLTAAQVVEMLNEVFSEFDLLVDKHGLEKIKTIGDCYMVASGVPIPRSDHADVMVRLALEMRDLVASREFAGHKLAFRFGVNSGPVVAGVIGRRKFIYDLWGDTVNVASRMESHGSAGVVQITEATRGRVAGAFVCEPRGKVEIKGKGEMPVFHVLGARAAAA